MTKDQMENVKPNPSGLMKAEQPKSQSTAVRDPDDAEKRAIAAARQTIAEMPLRFDVGAKIKTENGTTQILQGPQ